MKIAVPSEVAGLLDQIVQAFIQLLGSDLVGIYLHGSLAMGSFNPHSSDIDFLVITEQPLSPEKRRKIAAAMLALTGHAPAKGLEMSVLTRKALQQFRYPTPFEFHFSNSWLERYRNNEVDFGDMERVDADLAAHLTITKARGVVLYGAPIEAVFPDVPSQYYRDSILRDAKDILADMIANPVYNVLNLCRVRAYLEAGMITSKREGGEWALEHATAFQKTVITQALAEYSGQRTAHWESQALERFGREMGHLLPV